MFLKHLAQSVLPKRLIHGRSCRLTGRILALFVPIFMAVGPVRSAPTETLVPLLQQPIPSLPGHTLTAVTVVFPPGSASIPHRHGDAFLYAYVLEGAVRSQIEGQALRIYRAGESWTEKPGDHHVLTENDSANATARLLVVFVAATGADLKTDDRHKDP